MILSKLEDSFLKALQNTAPNGIAVKKLTIARGGIGYFVHTSDFWLLAKTEINLADLNNYGFERYGKFFWECYRLGALRRRTKWAMKN